MMKASGFLVLLAFIAVVLAVEVEVLDPSKAVDNQYIFVFHENTTETEKSAHIKGLYLKFKSDDFENRIINTFSIGNFKGFSARLSSSLLETQKSALNIKHIEQDSKVSISQSCTKQSGATWGLDRISEVVLNLDGNYFYGATGAGVDSYIVDTGILTTHVDFGGRAIWGANFADNTNTDCNGHGTHVAGTVGSNTYGVAKGTTLIAVKVLDCDGSGTNAGVISGINWVVTSSGTRKRKSVANMSLGGSKSTALNTAIKNAVHAGITFVVAAGNENQDACNTSPASEALAITVGATGTDQDGVKQVDNRAYFSNYGTCLTLFAPGVMITSTWIGSNTAINTISGTSMASPHVAGVAALYVGQNPNATPANVKSALLSNAGSGGIKLDCSSSKCNSSPNKMLFSPCSA